MIATPSRTVRALAAAAAALAATLPAAALLVPAAAAAQSLPIPAIVEAKAAAVQKGPDASRASEPAAIPLPQVSRAAVDAYKTIQFLAERAAAEGSQRALLDQASEAVQAAARMWDRVTPDRLEASGDRQLSDIRQDVDREDAALARAGARLEDALATIYEALAEMKRLTVRWTLTEEAARAEGAPPELLARIAEVRADVAAVDGRARKLVKRLLEAQDQIAAQRIRILRTRESVLAVQANRARLLFEIEARPLWEMFQGAPPRGLGKQIAGAVSQNFYVTRDFLRDERSALWVPVLAYVLLVMATRSLGRRIAAKAKEDPALVAPAEVLAHPFAAAALVVLGVFPALFQSAISPAAYRALALLLTLPPFLVVMRGITPPHLRRFLYELTALFAVTRTAVLLPEYSLAGRVAMIAVALVALGGILRVLASRTWKEKVVDHGQRRWAQGALLVSALLLAASVISNVVGNVNLSRRLVMGTVTSAQTAALMLAMALVLRALLVAASRGSLARRFAAHADRRDAMVKSGSRVVRNVALLVWALATADIFYVAKPLWDAIGVVMAARLRVGGLNVSIGDLVAFGVTVWLSLLLSRLLAFVTEGVMRDRGLPAGVPTAVSKTVGYAVILVGSWVAMLASGLDLTRFTVLAGTLGVGIGFGLQNIVNNFVSGLLLLYERPVRLGDVVEVGRTVGEVSRIGIRSSTIRTFDGSEVVVPNSNLISTELTNWTLSDSARRTVIDVGVAYGSDPERVARILVEAARSHAGVMAMPEPSAVFVGFGDSALNFQLRLWSRRYADAVQVGSEVRMAVNRMLGEAGISIPFPQRDLHLVSVDDEAAKALRPAGTPPSAP